MNYIDHSSAIPLHIQVERYLRELVKQEEYQNGKLLPNELALSKRFGISRGTFRSAMDRLVRDGLVTRKKGIGSVVNKKRLSTTLSRWSSFSEEMSTKGIELRTISKKIKRVEADGATALALGIKEGETVCRLERLKGADGVPVVLFISYFHPRVEISDDEDFDGKLYDILEQKYHVVPAISNEEIGAFKTDGYFAKKLNVKKDIPILFRRRHVLDASGKILELCNAYYRSDKFVYNIQIKRGSE
jgi:GntR family transcriptional regulator